MIPAPFTKFLEQINGLTDSQLRQVEKRLEGNDEVTSIVKQLEQRMVDSPECPHCHSSLINRHGKTDNMQRYRCKNCNKTFVATTATPLARLRYKELWMDYIGCMLQSKVLRDCADELNISLGTSFRWRHRFLTLPATLKAKQLEGIIEADETLFARSEKGSRH